MAHAITCPTYTPPDDSSSTKCQNHKARGYCKLGRGRKCIEWQKANKQFRLEHPPSPPKQSAPEEPPKPEPSTERAWVPIDLPPPPPPTEPPIVRNLSAEEIQSFADLGAEVCIASDHVGEIWIVPSYGENDRLEISAEHAATLAAICSSFPGARVVAFRKLKSD